MRRRLIVLLVLTTVLSSVKGFAQTAEPSPRIEILEVTPLELPNSQTITVIFAPRTAQSAGSVYSVNGASLLVGGTIWHASAVASPVAFAQGAERLGYAAFNTCLPSGRYDDAWLYTRINGVDVSVALPSPVIFGTGCTYSGAVGDLSSVIVPTYTEPVYATATRMIAEATQTSLAHYMSGTPFNVQRDPLSALSMQVQKVGSGFNWMAVFLIFGAVVLLFALLVAGATAETPAAKPVITSPAAKSAPSASIDQKPPSPTPEPSTLPAETSSSVETPTPEPIAPPVETPSSVETPTPEPIAPPAETLSSVKPAPSDTPAPEPVTPTAETTSSVQPPPSDTPTPESSAPPEKSVESPASAVIPAQKDLSESIKVFLSYRRTESAILANLIARDLAHRRIDAYFDTRRTDGAGTFPDRLLHEIERCEMFVVLLGKSTLESEWVLREIEHASKIGKPMLPVFQESYEPSPPANEHIARLLQYSGVHILDQRNIYIDEALRDIASIVRAVRKKPS